MAEIVFDKEFPESIRDETEKNVKNAAWLLPLWLQRLYVGWDTNDKDSNAYIRVDKDYRFARLTICSGWLDGIPERRQESIIHEIIHCFTAPISDYAKEILDAYCSKDDSPKANEIISAEIHRKCEAITQDFAYAIAKKLNAE